MKKNIKVIVWESESCVYDLPTNPQKFLKWWVDKFNSIPEEYKESASINCDVSTYYDSPMFSVEIYYYRIETDDEEAIRLEIEKVHQKTIKSKELLQLKKLRDKYGV